MDRTLSATNVPPAPALDRAAVVGRLARFVAAWERSGADPLTLSWLREGVPILFDSTPHIPSERPNIVAHADQLQFMRTEVATMLHLGAVSRCIHRPTAVWQLLTAPKAGPRRFRLVVNMKPLTPVVHSPPFKLERLEEFLTLLRPGDMVWTRDLRDGYFHVPMHETAKPWLGFRLDGVYYRYNVLPFGLRSAPFVFTKLLRTPMRSIRQLGVRSTVYIDDVACAAQPHIATDQVQLVDRELATHGLVVATDKNQGPATTAIVLGLQVDTVNNRLSLPADKLTKTLALLRAVQLMAERPSHRVPARVVAQLLGKLQWFSRAAPPARLYSRTLQYDLRARASWSDRVVISPQTRADLRTVSGNAQRWNARGAPIWPTATTAQVFTDASNSGWGAALHLDGAAARYAQGLWKNDEELLHINAKELLAVVHAVHRFAHELRGRVVDFRVDNVTAVAYLRGAGGAHPHLTVIARQALETLLKLRTQAVFHHLRGVLNIVADALSRGKFVPVLTHQHGQLDPDDIQLRPDLFAHLDRLWGPHTVDRFSRAASAHTPRFWSRVLEPGCEGINSLTAHWGGENNWVFPPLHMLLPVLNHILRCQAAATVVLPLWPAQPWWPVLCSIAVDMMELPPSPMLRNGVSIADKNKSWRWLAVRVVGSPTASTRGMMQMPL